jgi:pimeloyl-ACP methyl ester carboxylesterase
MFDLAHAWQTAGQYFTWHQEQAGMSGDALQIFYRCLGNPTHPAIVVLHGFPTSSYDFHTLALDLSTDQYVCLLDFPGFGFSDKPLSGYGYTLREDAQLLDFFIHDIVGLQCFALLNTRSGGQCWARLAGSPSRSATANVCYHPSLSDEWESVSSAGEPDRISASASQSPDESGCSGIGHGAFAGPRASGKRASRLLWKETIQKYVR